MVSKASSVGFLVKCRDWHTAATLPVVLLRYAVSKFWKKGLSMSRQHERGKFYFCLHTFTVIQLPVQICVCRTHKCFLQVVAVKVQFSVKQLFSHLKAYFSCSFLSRSSVL